MDGKNIFVKNAEKAHGDIKVDDDSFRYAIRQMSPEELGKNAQIYAANEQAKLDKAQQLKDDAEKNKQTLERLKQEKMQRENFMNQKVKESNEQFEKTYNESMKKQYGNLFSDQEIADKIQFPNTFSVKKNKNT